MRRAAVSCIWGWMNSSRSLKPPNAVWPCSKFAPPCARPVAGGPSPAQVRFAPLAGSDAKSGVAGFMVAARELNQALNDWLIQLAHDRPEAVAACRA